MTAGAVRGDLVALLRTTHKRGVVLSVDGESLRWDAPAGAVDEELLAWIRAVKPELVRFLVQAGGVQRVTHYVPMRDGVQLHADVFRPKRDGVVVAGPCPVIWCHERYSKADVAEDESRLDTAPWLRTMLEQGYVVASVDARGTGGSTGQRLGEFSAAETLDSYDVTEWLAERSFCDGNVGMFGDSYLGITQLLAASVAPPHLRCIFPGVALGDLYDFLYPGGVYRHDFAQNWSELVRVLDPALAADGGVFALTETLPHRDSLAPDGSCPYEAQSPLAYVDAVNRSGIPVQLLSGWYDLWVRDAMSWHAALTGDQRLLVGPWCHNDRSGVDLATEHLRWFDQWLKGIDTGVMSEPRIRYYTVNAHPDDAWRTAETWPPPGSRSTTLLLSDAGALCFAKGHGTSDTHAVTGVDRYRVDYATTSGRRSRWVNGYLTYAFGADRFGYDLTENDERSLTYTSAPLPGSIEVTGHPVVRLHVDSTHDDGDFFVYLQEVDAAGVAHYVTEGVLRASFRAVEPGTTTPWGAPTHPATAASVEPLPTTGPAELVVEMLPTSTIFRAGSRIRLSIACCDYDNARTPVIDPPPVVGIHRGPAHRSALELPVVTR